MVSQNTRFKKKEDATFQIIEEEARHIYRDTTSNRQKNHFLHDLYRLYSVNLDELTKLGLRGPESEEIIPRHELYDLTEKPKMPYKWIGEAYEHIIWGANKTKTKRRLFCGAAFVGAIAATFAVVAQSFWRVIFNKKLFDWTDIERIGSNIF